MEISQHIKHLLYQHDCVIVPGLGGFVCAHKKLEFNIHTGLITPPKKTVAFNANLNNNDGLLANYIAQKENRDYGNALENINAWVSNLHRQLQNGETINIKGLGSFSLNNAKKLVFIPFADVNFSTHTYGLEAVTLNKKIGKATVKEEKVKAAVPPPLPPKETEKPKVVEKKKEKKEKPKAKKAAATVAPKRKRTSYKALRKVAWVFFTLILFFALFILQDYAYHAKMNKGGLFDFKQKEHKKEQDTPKKSAVKPIVLESQETIGGDDYTQETENNSLENNTVAQNSVEISDNKTAQTDSVFYIIAGAFSSESNAQDLQNELTNKGFAPEIIKVDGSSLYRVGYQRYTSRKKAEGDLNPVRNKTHNFAAWVLAVKP